MKNIIYIRWLHMKGQLWSVFLWLIFPVVATIALVYALNLVKDDASIPIGIVLEEESLLATEFVDKLAEESFFTIHLMDETEALNDLQKHELDSVFILKKGYEEQIKKGNRNKLLRGYKSDMSFAYASTLETVQSLVQQQTSRYKAANEVAKLYRQFERPLDVTEEALIEKSIEIEAERTLLHTSLRYVGTDHSGSEADNFISPLFVWAFLSFLATFFLFDWVMKERHTTVAVRFLYTKKSMTTYLLSHLLLYTVVLFVVDLATMFLFQFLYGDSVTVALISSLFLYRFLLNSSAFLVSSILKRPFVFYLAGLSLFLLCVVTYIFGLTLNGTMFVWLHPMEAFLQGKYMNLWLLLNITCLLFIVVRKGDTYVTRATSS